MSNPLHSVPTLAANMPTHMRNKKACFNIIKDMVNSPQSPPSTMALAALYSHFMPAPPARPKTAEEWVLKAVAKQDVRFYLQWANAHSSMIRCTDGHRIHAAPTKRKDGYYDTALSAIEESPTFPDIERVIPTSKGQFEIDLSDLKAFEVRVTELNGKDMNALILDPKTLMAVGLKYLRDALSNPSPLVSAKIKNDASTPLHLTFEDGSFAVIMGVRLKI